MGIPNINWAVPLDRGQRVSGDKTVRMLITDRPRGVRFNAYLSQKWEKQGVKYVAIGMVDEDEEKNPIGLIVVKPVYSADQGYALIGNKHAKQVSAAQVYHWAKERGFDDAIGHRIVGRWDEDEGIFVFDVKDVCDDQEDDVQEG